MDRNDTDRDRLVALHDGLLTRFGPQDWWPGEGPWDVCTGAVLTQNTRWANAERALKRLADAGLRTPKRVLEAPESTLQALIRSAGFFRQKSRALQGLAEWVLAGGGFDQRGQEPMSSLREELLALPGVGPETADCILLYALDQPVFIADAYARRLLRRTGIWPDTGANQYAALKDWAEGRLSLELVFMQEFHALIVAAGKTYCQRQPRCTHCPLRSGCKHANRDY